MFRPLLITSLLVAGVYAQSGPGSPQLPSYFCTDALRALWTICDPLASLDARAADLVSRLSVADKLSSLITHTPALNSVGLLPYDWWSEATHGITQLPGGDRMASNTALPITTSCAFNRTLWRATGNVIGREARAYINAGEAYGTYWAPVINIVRDPRWGRNLESAGEDPFLSGTYAVEFVTGFEHSKETPYFPLQASACCKVRMRMGKRSQVKRQVKQATKHA